MGERPGRVFSAAHRDAFVFDLGGAETTSIEPFISFVLHIRKVLEEWDECVVQAPDKGRLREIGSG